MYVGNMLQSAFTSIKALMQKKIPEGDIVVEHKSPYTR